MKIAIAGYGVEGEENYRYWLKHIEHAQRDGDTITIVDERTEPSRPLPTGVDVLLGEGVFGNLDDFDLVVRTAGLAPYNIQTKGTIWSATNEFFLHCPAPIIGVTGSKGKGTTSSLITAMLKAAGKNVWLVGNIGVPALGVLDDIDKDDIVVYELSSFQLWDLQRSPQTAVVLMIEQEHLDVHRDMDDYVAAKSHITTHQQPDDTLIYNARNQFASHIASLSSAQKIAFPTEATAHIRDGFFYYGTQQLCSVDTLRLVGEHNQMNAIAAINAVWQYSQEPRAIAEGLSSFHGLAHRLSYVATIDGVAYYDDSIATTPSSAIAALRAFRQQPRVIILGGSYKGSDFSELANELARSTDVQAIIIGDEATRIAQACDRAGFHNYQQLDTDTLQAKQVSELVVARAAEIAKPGSVVLLSPATASFGLFHNYVERGEQFIAAVLGLQARKV